MKKILLILLFVIFSISNLSAKTVWIFDETDSHFSEFYNAIWDNLKDTEYGPYCKYVPKGEAKDKIKPGDAVLQLSGLYLETTGEPIFTYNVLMLMIDNAFNWNYRSFYMDAGTYVTQKDKASRAAEDILIFLRKDFKIN
ncbi:MAG: hypothetical protein A2X64_09455 [Ignavibacteria bacterium GWF2_33_9]|nr:MAG: hypothetical protein A2X64_09455 [Ignavibacteria bacterium GWF2_33_9]